MSETRSGRSKSRQWNKLKPEKGWMRRCGHYVRHKWIPSLYRKRTGESRSVEDWSAPDSGIWLNWIGHAGFWIQMGGFSFVVDPNWALWHGPIKRVRRPGLILGEMPEVDLVLVTHAHYDHLHKPSLRRLDARMGVVVPDGCRRTVRRLGFHKTIEMEPGQTHLFEREDHDERVLEVMMSDVLHWGARSLHDGHKSYGSYLVREGNMSLFHCGDSAYFDGFKKLGEERHIDVALLPIGAYGTPSGRSMHMNPEEAVQTFIDLKADWLVPMHYGTFPLGLERKGEPLTRLRAEVSRLGLEDKLILPREGHPVHIDIETKTIQGSLIL